MNNHYQVSTLTGCRSYMDACAEAVQLLTESCAEAQVDYVVEVASIAHV